MKTTDMKSPAEIVTSLEISKKLKNAGVPQNSLFDWLWIGENRYEVHLKGSPYHEDCEVVASAFTASELGRMIPDRVAKEHSDGRREYVFIDCDHHDSPCGYRCWLSYARGQSPHAIQPNDNEPSLKTEEEARALMVLHLLNENLISFT